MHTSLSGECAFMRDNNISHLTALLQWVNRQVCLPVVPTQLLHTITTQALHAAQQCHVVSAILIIITKM